MFREFSLVLLGCMPMRIAMRIADEVLMAGENKLSDKALRALNGKVQAKQRVMADGRGLSIRVSKKGAISFVFFFRTGGRDSSPVWMTLGRYPDITLKQAREKRDECRSWLAAGLDPRKENKSQRDISFNPVTVKDAVDYWFENYAKEHRKETKKSYNKYINHIFPYVGDVPVNKCTLTDWLKCFDRIRKGAPVQSGAILIELKQIFKFCRVRQYVVYNALDDLAPTDVGKYQNKSDRMLCEKQVGDIWRVYFHEEGETLAMPYKRRMAVLCLAFGCRLSEARLSTWEEWDLDNWIWTVPKEHSKNGNEIVRPIPNKMRQWITNLHAETKRSSYILGELKTAAAASCEGCTNHVSLKHQSKWSLHDLRRVFSTGLNDMGVDFLIVEQLLGHSIKGVAGIYNRSRYLQQKLNALELWVKYLDKTSVQEVSRLDEM